jgi:hypothetical protein
MIHGRCVRRGAHSAALDTLYIGNDGAHAIRRPTPTIPTPDRAARGCLVRRRPAVRVPGAYSAAEGE